MLTSRANLRLRSYPLVSWSIILFCALVFFYELSLEPVELEGFTTTWGMTPARLHLFAPRVLLADPAPLLTLVTSLFIHGGWVHLLSNMLMLFVFCANVEGHLGRRNFLLFYLLSGAVAGLLQALLFQTSTIPIIGASGAVAAVLGAHFLCCPIARLHSPVPVPFIAWRVGVPAFFYLGLWFLLQLYSGILSLRSGGTAVAWWAHIGGFLFGIIFARYFIRGVRKTSPWYPTG